LAGVWADDPEFDGFLEAVLAGSLAPLPPQPATKEASMTPASASAHRDLVFCFSMNESSSLYLINVNG
jgi:hypothetical protein